MDKKFDRKIIERKEITRNPEALECLSCDIHGIEKLKK
jgi:hypothetical protein